MITCMDIFVISVICIGSHLQFQSTDRLTDLSLLEEEGSCRDPNPVSWAGEEE